MALDDTYGGGNADTYIARADADVWIRDNRIYFDEWVNATEAQRDAALRQATRDIDSRVWHGDKFFYTQRLTFPRVPPGEAYPYGAGSLNAPDATFYDSLTIDTYRGMQRDRVRAATCLHALYLLENEGRNPDREDQFQGAASSTRGGGRASETRSFHEPSMVLCPEAWDMLRAYKGTTRLVRGDAGMHFNR